MKVVKLTIDEDNEFEGIDAVALVAEPAIELDFQYFSAKKFEQTTQYFINTYNDYPKAAITAAKQGIKRNEAIKNKCATQVGKVRAQQLANGENLSLDTIKRMRSFLLRQKDNYELAVKRSEYDACGYISYLLWGGPAALPWATKKLRMAGELDDNTQDIIMNEMGRFADIKEIEGIPVFVNENQANKMATNIGCAGSHKHEVGGTTYYMPCQTHEIATDKLLKKKEFHSEKHFDNFTEEEKEQLLKSLKSVGKLEEDNVSAGWVEITEDDTITRKLRETHYIQEHIAKYGAAPKYNKYKTN